LTPVRVERTIPSVLHTIAVERNRWQRRPRREDDRERIRAVSQRLLFQHGPAALSVAVIRRVADELQAANAP